VLVAEALVFDAVHEREALGAVYGFDDEFDELLRVALKVIQAPAFNENANKGFAGELGFVLKVGEDVGENDVALVERDRGGTRLLDGVDAGAANGEPGFAPLQASIRDGRSGWTRPEDLVKLWQ